MWKAGWSPSPQAEEDKEEQTDSQLDASSSQTVTPVAEALSTEPAPADGPASSLGPLDLLSREELLTDTSNSSSSTGEEGEAGSPPHPRSCTSVLPKWGTSDSGGIGTRGGASQMARDVGQTTSCLDGDVARKGRLGNGLHLFSLYWFSGRLDSCEHRDRSPRSGFPTSHGIVTAADVPGVALIGLT